MIEYSFELNEEEVSVTTLIEDGLQEVFWYPGLASSEGRDWGFKSQRERYLNGEHWGAGNGKKLSRDSGLKVCMRCWMLSNNHRDDRILEPHRDHARISRMAEGAPPPPLFSR